MKIGVVYKVVHVASGHTYVGASSRSLQLRRGEHLWTARNGKGSIFHRDLAQFPDQFTWEVIEQVPVDQLLSREAFYIDSLHPYYNFYKGSARKREFSSLRKKVINVTTNETFISAAQAAQAYGLDCRAIPRVIRAKCKAAGCYWSYL